MSLGRKCDSCGKPIEDGSPEEKPMDLLILIDGDVAYEFEDLCSSCRLALKEFVESGFKVPPKAKEISIPERTVFPSNCEPKTAYFNNPTPQNTANDKPDSAETISSENKASDYVPFSGVAESELSDSVTKRWSIPSVKHSK